jgi:murein DD-endopeptidase MepM/ murein hydrolase activator NlpD
MLNAEGLPIPTRALRCTLNGFQLPAVCKRLAAWLHSRAPVAALRIPTLFSRLVLLGVLVGSGLSPASADYPFRLFIREAGTGHEIVAENNGPAPITVYVSLTGQKFATDGNWPMTTVVPPHVALRLGHVYPIYPDNRTAAGYNFYFHYRYNFGRLDAVHDAGTAYRLPFEDGRGFLVSQAYGGMLTTHNNRAEMYALDFAMPIGSAVTAARAGVVIEVTLSHHQGGDDVRYLDKANRVAIVHDDGTVAEYAHLSPGPEIVTVGQRVAAGELLGYSGSTGYASGPHLHFMVWRPRVIDGNVSRASVPVLFYANDPAVRFSAQDGTTVWSNYGKPAATQTAHVGGTGRESGFTSQAN